MTLMLQTCQNAQILKHVQRLVIAAMGVPSAPGAPAVKPSLIGGKLTVVLPI